MEKILDLEFFKTRCSNLTKHFYVMYSLAGGIFFENYARFGFRIFVGIFAFVAYFICTIPPVKILIGKFPLQDVYLALGFFVFMQTAIVNVYLLYSRRTQFRRLFQFITQSVEIPSADFITNETQPEETNVRKVCFYIHVGYAIWCMMLYSSKLCLKMLNLEMPFSVDYSWDFFVPFSFENCQTPTCYVIWYNVTFISCLPFGVIFYNILSLLWTVLVQFKNRAVVLRSEMKFYSDVAFDRLEKCDQREEQEVKKRRVSYYRLRCLALKRKRHVEEFMSKVPQWIRIYQRLITCVKLYRKCAIRILAFHTAINAFSITSSGFFAMILQDRVDITDAYYWYLMYNLVLLLICCVMGNILDDMNDIVTDAIYSMPWYYMTPKDQKIILTFLCIAQNTKKMKLFGMFPLNLELYPKIINNIYGYIQIIRLIVIRNCK